MEWAVRLARQAVNCAPSEFITWEKLTDLYIDLGQYEFTLNSCPMFTINGQYMHHSLPAAKILLPSHRAKTELPEGKRRHKRRHPSGMQKIWERACAREYEGTGIQRPVQTAARKEKGGSTVFDAAVGSTVEAFFNKRLSRRGWSCLWFCMRYVSFRLHAARPDQYRYMLRISACGQFSAEVAHLKTRLVACCNGIGHQGYTISIWRTRISGVWIQSGMYILFSLPSSCAFPYPSGSSST